MNNDLTEMKKDGVKIDVLSSQVSAYENAGWKKVKTKPSKQKELDNGDS